MGAGQSASKEVAEGDAPNKKNSNNDNNNNNIKGSSAKSGRKDSPTPTAANSGGVVVSEKQSEQKSSAVSFKVDPRAGGPSRMSPVERRKGRSRAATALRKGRSASVPAPRQKSGRAGRQLERERQRPKRHSSAHVLHQEPWHCSTSRPGIPPVDGASPTFSGPADHVTFCFESSLRVYPPTK